MQCQARDTYLCTDCYVWDDAVERKRDISTVGPGGLSASWARKEGQGSEPPIESPLERGPSLSSEPLPPSTQDPAPAFEHTTKATFYKIDQ